MSKQKQAKQPTGRKPGAAKPQAKPAGKNQADTTAAKRAWAMPARLPLAAGMAVFAAVCLGLLLGVYGDYLRKMEALSLFLPTSMFLRDCMAVPGGLLAWLGAFINQFLYWPWAGALILCALLLGVWLAALCAFRVPRAWSLAASALPALLLLAFVRLGYVIFTLKPVTSVWWLPLGALASLLLLWGWRSLRPWWLRALGLCAVVVGGYPLFGFYALLAGAMCVCAQLSAMRRRDARAWVVVALGIALVAFVPKAWFWLVGGDLMRSQVYVTGLPRFFGYEAGMWSVYIVVFAMMLSAAALSGRWSRCESKPLRLKSLPMAVSGGVFAVSLACVMVFKYSDRDFMLTLALDRALWEQDWGRAVELAEGQDGEPTRLNSVLADIALLRLGQAPDRMFAVPYGFKPYKVERKTRPLHDADAALISYHLGLVNYAYRWSTEYNIEQGMSAQRLKMMAKCALLNYDLDLAKAYLDILYNTPAHREWARKHMRYCSNPVEMAADPELGAVMQLMCHRNSFVNDKGEFEGYVWPLLAAAEPGTTPFNELSMEAALLVTDLDAFMAKLPAYAAGGKHIPRHFQEAALLWSMLAKAPCPVPIDDDVQAAHDQFVHVFRNTAGDEDDAQAQRERMRPEFGRTYWYYYVFHSDKQLR